MSAPPIKILCRYQYDPLDRLVGLKPLESPGTQRFYQEDELVNEIEGESQLTIMRHGPQPLAQRSGTDAAAETTLLATDQQRSLLRTVADTDSRQMAYTAYGYRTGESGLSCLLGFNGERPDSITGHYLLGQGNRAFNPVLMRFNSPDELSPFGDGGINAYAYCGNDPVNRHDPSGNASFPLILKVRKLAQTALPPLQRTTLNPSTSRTISESNQTRILTPRKIWSQRYKTAPSTPSLLPAEPPLTPPTQINSSNIPIEEISFINRLINEATLYDKARIMHPIMDTWGDTPTHIQYKKLQAHHETLIANNASSQELNDATVKLTLARWIAKSRDIEKLTETLRTGIRSQ